MLWVGMTVLTYLGLISALICFFKKRVPQYFIMLSKGAIPLTILWIGFQMFRIIFVDPKLPNIKSGAPIALGMLFLGLLSWVYLLWRPDKKA